MPHSLSKLHYPIRMPRLVQALLPGLQWRVGVPNGVALTFDDGPTPGVTDRVLGVLEKHEVKATFFCVGSMVQQHPALCRRIVAQGHQLGNHTYTHPNGWRVSRGQYIEEVQRTDAIIADTVGQAPRYFRPPYGKLNLWAWNSIAKTHQIVMWEVVAADWEPRLSSADCLHNIVAQTRAGSIIVLHDSHKCGARMLGMLEPMLVALKARGLRFVGLD